MDFVQGINRNQLFIMNLNEHVADDSWARIVDLFVDSFDLDKLGFCDVLKKQGRPPFHNSVLLKLYLYGYKNNLRSSRKLQDACKINPKAKLFRPESIFSP